MNRDLDKTIPIEVEGSLPGDQPGSSPCVTSQTNPCPNCLEGRLEYDGSLNLVCDQCGFTLTGGGFT